MKSNIPLDNPHVLKECFDIFIEKINLIEDPFEQSFFALVHLSYMQLFEDVNKRTARLAANIPLIKQNLKPLSFIDINQNDYVMKETLPDSRFDPVSFKNGKAFNRMKCF